MTTFDARNADFPNVVDIPLAQVLLGATRIPADMGINDTYYGEIQLGTGEIFRSYIKDLNINELRNEILFYLLAKILQCPVADSFIAFSRPNILATTHAPNVNNGSIVFASKDQNLPSLKFILNNNSVDALNSAIIRICGFKNLDSIYAIDFLLANIDRNIGNILLGDDDFVLIDHGRCFGFPDTNCLDLDASKKYLSKVDLWLSPRIGEAAKNQIVRDAENRSSKLTETICESVFLAKLMQTLFSDLERNALKNFLSDRKTRVRQLVSDSLGIV
ncbi:MAG: hypothetical protein JWR10_2079 [Rubritepida sp.]|nr:hypothetical protein [Rubritepida sp.]